MILTCLSTPQPHTPRVFEIRNPQFAIRNPLQVPSPAAAIYNGAQRGPLLAAP